MTYLSCTTRLARKGNNRNANSHWKKE